MAVLGEFGLKVEMGWEIMEGRILATSFLEVSFQRYPRAPEGRIQAAPSSCGALPVALAASQRALVPLDAEEAVWIGLAARGEKTVVRVNARAETDRGPLDVTVDSGRRSQESGVLVPPTRLLEGIAAPEGGFWPIARVSVTPDAPAVRSLWIEATLFAARRAKGASPGAGQPQHGFGPSERQDPQSGAPNGAVAAGGPERIRIVFVAPANFADATGLTWTPLDQQSRYGGWRLP